jgi:methyl-accepting chemotaxis protein
MNATFSRIGLRGRLLALALLPCLALASILIERAFRKRTAAREADDLALLVRLTVIIGDLVHETQKERGASSLFMSSGGSTFVRELQAQRSSTDERRLYYMQFVRANDPAWSPGVVAALRLADAQLADIEIRRRQVSELAVPVPEIIGYYNELNRRLITAVASIASKSADADLRGWSTGYYAFLHAKENTGIERAQMANVFGADHFAPGQYFTIAALIASQRAYLHVFDSIAPAEVAQLYRDKAKHPAFAEVEAKERIAFDRGPGTRGGFGVDATAWFKAMTQKIDLMKEIENAMADAILARAAGMQQKAASSLQTTIALGVVLLLAAILVAYLLALRIVAPVRRLTAAVDRVSAGDLDQNIDTDAPAELGELARAFAGMVAALKAVRAAPVKSAAAPGRISGSRSVLRT